MKYKKKNPYSFLITNSELNEYLLLQFYFLKYTHQFLWTEHYYLAADVFTFGRLLYISVLNWTKSKQFMVTLPHILWDKLVCLVCFLKTKLLIAVSTFRF